MKILIVSDIHLGCKYNRKEDFLKILNSKKEEISKIIINGDFIDGWRIRKHGLKYLDKIDLKIFQTLLKFSKEKEIIIVQGNHDNFLMNFLDYSIGNIKFVESHIENNILFVHGDCFDSFTLLSNGFYAKIGDIGYNLLLRLNWVFKVFKISLAKIIKEKVKKVTSFITSFEYAAAKMAYNLNCKTVVCGHIHTIGDKEIKIKEEKIRYLNSGDFQEGASYIILNTKSGELNIHSL